MILFLHNRYRVAGGEERAVDDFAWLVRERLGEPAQMLMRSSEQLGRGRAAASLLRGGLDPQEVSSAVRLTKARVVHAHNLLPALGWRALAAARAAGARIVLHLHQYRLVCAIGVCYTQGAECTRCHGRRTMPGLRLNCRGSISEAAAYALSLSLWQPRLVAQADAVIVPSAFARERLRALGAPLPWERVNVIPPPLRILEGSAAAGPTASPGAGAAIPGAGAAVPGAGAAVPSAGAAVPSAGGSPGSAGEGAAAPRAAEPVPAARAPYALLVSRLAPEKGVEVAIDACRIAGIELVIAGDGPAHAALHERAGAGVRFAGRVSDAALDRLRADAAIALAPSLAGETFGLAAAEAMAAGLPVAASRVGALPELVGDEALVPPGDARALAALIEGLAGDRAAGERARQRVRALCAPRAVARALAAVYDGHGVGERAAAEST